MKPYELIEHVADAKFRAYGNTMDEAFANAIRAMTAIITDPDELERDKEIQLELNSFERSRLLYDLLDQLLFLMDTEHFVAAFAEDLSIEHHLGRYKLRATIVGTDVRKVGGNLKAVTYHEMKVEQLPDGTWVCQAVIDI